MTTNYKGFDPIEVRGFRGKERYKVSVTVKEEFLPLLQHHSDPSLEEDEQTTSSRLADFFKAMDKSYEGSLYGSADRAKVFYSALHMTTIHPEKEDSLDKIIENVPDSTFVKRNVKERAKELAPAFRKKLENIAKQKKREEEKKKERKKIKKLSKKVQMIDKKMDKVMEIVSTSVVINSQVANTQPLHANQLSTEGDKEINIKHDQLGESPTLYTFETKETEEQIETIKKIKKILGNMTEEEKISILTELRIEREQLPKVPKDFDDSKPQTVHINYTRKKSISSKGKKEEKEKPSKKSKPNQETTSNDVQNQKEANVSDENSSDPKSPKAENEIDEDVSTDDIDDDSSSDLEETEEFHPFGIILFENKDEDSNSDSSDLSSDESIEDEEHNLEPDESSSEDEELSPGEENHDNESSSEEDQSSMGENQFSPEENQFSSEEDQFSSGEDQFSPGDNDDAVAGNESYGSDECFDDEYDRSDSVSPQHDPPTPVKEYNFFFN